METEVYTKRLKSGKILLSKVQKPNYQRHFAVWRDITVELWRKVAQRDFNPMVIPNTERKVWQYLLLDSSILDPMEGREKHFPDGSLRPEALNLIMNFSPSSVPASLFNGVPPTATVPNKDAVAIKYQCHQLWIGKGSKLENPHPLLEEAVTAMVFKERYGMPIFESVSEMPQRLYVAYRMVSSLYGEIQAMNMQTRDLGEKAKRLSSLMGGPGGDATGEYE